METRAVIVEQPGALALEPLSLTAPGPGDLIVETLWTGVSTGTEKLFWSGRMPPFPGMGYPLVPGYEAVGEVVEAGSASGRRPGERVFVPGATCYGPREGKAVRGLFGATASRLTVPAARTLALDPELGPDAALMALAATAYHALTADRSDLPELIVGHGVLGRLMARLVLALGGAAPTVWEISESRRAGAVGYQVRTPDDDPRRDYRTIMDVSGDAAGIDALIERLAPGGELVLAGFYPAPVSFAFPPAFLREARLRVAAEWAPDDLAAVGRLVDDGRLSLSGLISHTRPAREAEAAYPQAFDDPTCLKMILDWRDV